MRPNLSLTASISSNAYFTPLSLFTFNIDGVSANFLTPLRSVIKYLSSNPLGSNAKCTHNVFPLTAILQSKSLPRLNVTYCWLSRILTFVYLSKPLAIFAKYSLVSSDASIIFALNDLMYFMPSLEYSSSSSLADISDSTRFSNVSVSALPCSSACFARIAACSSAFCRSSSAFICCAIFFSAANATFMASKMSSSPASFLSISGESVVRTAESSFCVSDPDMRSPKT